MARIRTIKPSFWVSDDIGAIDWFARLVFIGLITQADDDGRLSAGASKVRVLLFPWDDPTEAQPLVEGALGTLSEQGLIVRYMAGGKERIALPTWDDHQKIAKRTASRIPAPDSSSPPVVLPESSSSPPARKGAEGKRNGKGKEEDIKGGVSAKAGPPASAPPRKKRATSRKRAFTDKWDAEYLAHYGRPNPEWTLSGAAEGRAADRLLSALAPESEQEFWAVLAAARKGEGHRSAEYWAEKAATLRGFATVYGAVAAAKSTGDLRIPGADRETPEDRERKQEVAKAKAVVEESRAKQAMEERLARMTPEQRAEHTRKIEKLKAKLARGGVSSLVNIKEA